MHISDFLKQPHIVEKSPYKNKRDELLSNAVEDINLLRKKENWRRYVKYLKSVKKSDTETNRNAFKETELYIKYETKQNLAKRLNMNPFLKGNKNDGELELILNECRTKRNYSKLYFTIK